MMLALSVSSSTPAVRSAPVRSIRGRASVRYAAD